MNWKENTELIRALQKETPVLTAQIRALYKELDAKFHLHGSQKAFRKSACDQDPSGQKWKTGYSGICAGYLEKVELTEHEQSN